MDIYVREGDGGRSFHAVERLPSVYVCVGAISAHLDALDRAGGPDP